MDTNLIAAIISGFVATFGILFAYTQWRRDVKIKLGQFRETVSVELIRQRMEPYSELMHHLEMLSSVHEEELMSTPKKMQVFIDNLQNLLYGKVGLLASHETRLMLIYLRSGCMGFMKRKIAFHDLMMRLWALHFSLRSDLGISQPSWTNEIERIRNEPAKDDEQTIAELINTYPWESTLYHQLAEKTPIRFGKN
jgi:hypothetical protein